MIDKIKKNDNFSFKSKRKNINFLNRWGLFTSGGLTTIMLITWWIFNINYESIINELLKYSSRNNIFNFAVLNNSIFAFILLYVVTLVITLFFLKKYDVISIIVSGAFIIISGLLLIFMIVFAVNDFDGFQAYISMKGINNIILLLSIHWLFVVIFASSTIGFSCWLIFSFFSKKLTKSGFLNQQDIIEEEQSKVNNDPHTIINISNISVDLASMENNEVLTKVKSESIPLSSIDQSEVDNDTSNNKHHMREKAEKPDLQSLENNRLQVQPGATAIQISTLKVEISQPLNEKIVAKDVTSTSYQEQTDIISDNNIVESQLSQQPASVQGNVSLSQAELNNGKFVENVYSKIPSIQGIPPESLPLANTPKSNTINTLLTPPVLKVEISQPLHPQKPEPEPPKKTSSPLKVWTNEQINGAWERGLLAPTYESETYRCDYAGALMFKGSFVANPTEENNNVRSYSWTIVYQRPLAAGGTEEASNLWPLNCMNALAKGQNYPKWKTIITFNGRENVIKEKRWKGKRKLPKIKS